MLPHAGHDEAADDEEEEEEEPPGFPWGVIAPRRRGPKRARPYEARVPACAASGRSRYSIGWYATAEGAALAYNEHAMLVGLPLEKLPPDQRAVAMAGRRADEQDEVEPGVSRAGRAHDRYVAWAAARAQPACAVGPRLLAEIARAARLPGMGAALLDLACAFSSGRIAAGACATLGRFARALSTGALGAGGILFDVVSTATAHALAPAAGQRHAARGNRS
jgi:hypothetical protein